MSARREGVPLLLRLSARLLPADAREDVLGDLLEHWRGDVSRRGLASRAAWLVRQPAAALRARLGEGRRGSEARRPYAARRGPRVSALDVKLGVRMLAKYPGLSLVSVTGMSVAIAIAGGYYGAIGAMIDPSLPLDEGDRIVSVVNADLADPDDPMERSAHDFVAWRDELRSIRDLAAYRNETRNLIVEGRGAELVDVALMTAAGFRVARVPPVLGRPILEEDEREGAPPVVVIAYEEWQDRFDADPAILGRAIQLGSTPHTVVGVMPEGYRFPRHHRFWAPLQLNVNAYGRGEGPILHVFGRLADGVSMEQAQAELNTVGLRSAAAWPETHEHLRPKVSPYAHPFMNIYSSGQAVFFRTLQLALGLLLVVALNVAVLVYARTMTRAGEIAVRGALGASRRRILTQLFAEAVVLSSVAAAVGLFLAAVGLRFVAYLNDAPGGDYTMPFWVEIGLTPGVVAYVAGLAILAGLIIGVLPGLKVTGRIQEGLQQLTSRGTGKPLGRTWTALIVLQVGIAVAILPFAVHVARGAIGVAGQESGYAAEQVLRATLLLRPELGPSAIVDEAAVKEMNARFADRTAELLRRLEAEPGFAAASVATSFPGNGWSYEIEVDGGSGRSGTATGQDTDAVLNNVGPSLFATLDVPILAGRAFVEADAAEGSTAAIVDRGFAERVLGGGAAVGRRFRLADTASSAGDEPAPGPWLEVVGVVPDFTVEPGWGEPDPKVYLPLRLAEVDGYLQLAVRTRGSSAPAVGRRLTEIAAEVDPTLQLLDLRSAADVDRNTREFMLLIAIAVAAVTLSVLLLSATGIYAMMSFTVAGRRREIGIRTALGADRRGVLAGVFARAGAQLGAGVLTGIILAVALNQVTGDFGPDSLLLFPAVAALMIGVGLLSAFGPARRALDVQPTEALRGE